MDGQDLLCLLLVVCLCGALLAGFPVAFTLAGISLVFAGIGAVAGVFDAAFLTAFPPAVFSVMSSDVLVAVPLFVLMGVALERSRVAEDLLSGLGDLFDAAPGGLAISVAAVGTLMAASTGIVGATVVTMGLLSLPIMLRRGYDPAFATGSIAASGTLGQIIPPSIVLILLGDQMSTAYQNAQFSAGIFSPDTVAVSDFFAGALVPGLLLAGSYAAYQMFYALAFPSRAPRAPQRAPTDQTPRIPFSQTFRVLVAPLVLIVAVLGSILGGLASPSEAAGVGALGALLLAGARLEAGAARPALLAAASAFALVGLAALFDLRLQRDSIPLTDTVAIALSCVLSALVTWGILRALRAIARAAGDDGRSVLRGTLESTLLLTSMIFMIVIAARLFAIVFRGFGGDEAIEGVLLSLPGGTFGAVLAVMALMFVMGFFLDFLEILFIVVPVVAPVLLQLQWPDGQTIDPVWLGVMMAVNLQTSFLTPPFGFALFYLRGVAPDSVRTVDLYRGIVPFVCLQIAMLGLLWRFPDLATWLPGLI
ncbi:MAG: TRAP transporter large permease subunit [Pseudomonadota bacterium]